MHLCREMGNTHVTLSFDVIGPTMFLQCQTQCYLIDMLQSKSVFWTAGRLRCTIQLVVIMLFKVSLMLMFIFQKKFVSRAMYRHRKPALVTMESLLKDINSVFPEDCMERGPFTPQNLPNSWAVEPSKTVNESNRQLSASSRSNV